MAVFIPDNAKTHVAANCAKQTMFREFSSIADMELPDVCAVPFMVSDDHSRRPPKCLPRCLPMSNRRGHALVCEWIFLLGEALAQPDTTQ